MLKFIYLDRWSSQGVTAPASGHLKAEIAPVEKRLRPRPFERVGADP